MLSTNVRTRIGQFFQPSTTAVFAAVSANAFYLSGVAISTSGGGSTGSSGGGSITGGANTGSGVGLFSSTANANINIKSLVAGTNITIIDQVSEVQINATTPIGSISSADIISYLGL